MHIICYVSAMCDDLRKLSSESIEQRWVCPILVIILRILNKSTKHVITGIRKKILLYVFKLSVKCLDWD